MGLYTLKSMAGIYIHIPFCRKACNYCDFHFSTNLKLQEDMVSALIQELEARKDYLGKEKIDTLYFGGGTPSLLTRENLENIFQTIYREFSLSDNPEITLEANPDDLNESALEKFKNMPINRFSVGVQSFFEEDLVWMNRSHNADQAKRSIQLLQDSGYSNISLDLIFGFSSLTREKWEHNIKNSIELNIPHISTYGMTIEKGTLLGNLKEKGKYAEMEETLFSEQYLYLLETLEKSGYVGYEISNFAKPGFEARHNSNYWNQVPYLGIGPSAHSFNRSVRSWNISNNQKYIKGIKSLNPLYEEETLTKENQYLEYVLTSIRTQKGIEYSIIEERFGIEKRDQLKFKARPHIQTGNLVENQDHIRLSTPGKLISDWIIQDLTKE